MKPFAIIAAATAALSLTACGENFPVHDVRLCPAWVIFVLNLALAGLLFHRKAHLYRPQ